MTSQTAHRAARTSRLDAPSLWELVSAPEAWPSWNTSVEHITLDGPFESGTTGTLTPPGGQALPFSLVDVQPGRSYTSRTRIAETVTLESTLELVPDGDETLVRQQSSLVGPAAEYFADSFGPTLVRGVEATVELLAGGGR